MATTSLDRGGMTASAKEGDFKAWLVEGGFPKDVENDGIKDPVDISLNPVGQTQPPWEHWMHKRPTLEGISPITLQEAEGSSGYELV